MATVLSPTRDAGLRQALRLTYLSLAWMAAEGAAALWLGLRARSLLLEGFGLDSVLEMASAGVLLWRLLVEAGGAATSERIERVERQASRWVGCGLYLLAAGVVAGSVYGLLAHRQTDTHVSAWGVLIGLTAKVGMPVLAGLKLKVAARLGSRALRADAMEAITCGYLSVALMVGLAATRVFGWWWLDSILALALVPFLVKEGREAVTGECTCGGEPNAH